MRTYEVMIIVRPDILDEDVDKLVGTLEGHMSTAGATVKSTDRMGKRRLAYLVRKFQDGNYILFTVEAEGKAIAEIERRLRVTEPVIKFITVRIDEEQKRIEKMKKIRGAHVRRPAPAPEATAPAEAAPAGGEGAPANA